MNLGAPGSSQGRLDDAYIGDKKRCGVLMIDAQFWEQELLHCTDTWEKRKKGGIVLVARSATHVKGELRGRECKFYITCVQRGGEAALTEGGDRGMGVGEK